MRILVVDDHPDAAEVSCMLLELLGHETRSAITGRAALAEAETFLPEIVILDIGLPDLSGYEVARVLRQRHGTSMYLAAVTGWAQPEDCLKSAAAGIDQHLLKPADAGKLRAVIEAARSR